MYYSVLFSSLIALLVVILSLNVSKHRIKNGISLGDGENKGLRNAIRAHANLVETAPIFLLLMFAYESANNSTPFLLMCGLLFFFSRIMHSVGMLQYKLKLRFQLRRIGAGITSIVTVILAIGGLMSFI